MTFRQYRRSVGLRFGPTSVVTAFDIARQGGVSPVDGALQSFSNLDDDGIRIKFDFLRTSKGDADKGTIQLFNLTRDASDSIVADFALLRASRKAIKLPDAKGRAVGLEAVNLGFKVQLLAGYEKRLQLVFIGDYIKVEARKRVSATDFVTQITLGDSILSINDGFVSQGLGVGATTANIVTEFGGTMAVKNSADTTKVLTRLVGTSPVTTFANGSMAVMPAREGMDQFADLLGVQWFVREGLLYFLPKGEALTDFSLLITEGRDLLDFSQDRSDDEITGRTNLEPQIQPGRGIKIVDGKGQPIGAELWRVQTARYVGDTHGAPFYTEFVAKKALGFFPLPVTGLVG